MCRRHGLQKYMPTYHVFHPDDLFIIGITVYVGVFLIETTKEFDRWTINFIVLFFKVVDRVTPRFERYFVQLLQTSCRHMKFAIIEQSIVEFTCFRWSVLSE